MPSLNMFYVCIYYSIQWSRFTFLVCLRVCLFLCLFLFQFWTFSCQSKCFPEYTRPRLLKVSTSSSKKKTPWERCLHTTRRPTACAADRQSQRRQRAEDQQLLQSSSASSEAADGGGGGGGHLRNPSSDPNRIGKNDATIIRLECSSITGRASYRGSRRVILCPSWFGASHYSRREAGELERELGGMTAAITFSVLQAQPFFFFFFPSDTFIVKSTLLAPPMDTEILLKGQESTHWNLFIFVALNFLLRRAWRRACVPSSSTYQHKWSQNVLQAHKRRRTKRRHTSRRVFPNL